MSTSTPPQGRLRWQDRVLRAGARCVRRVGAALQARWSEREICPWYYRADSLVPRINNWIGDRDFVAVLERAGAAVLYSGELTDYPNATSYLASHFTRTQGDDGWELWVRKRQ